jgi:2',3'-cyclic-nucleotide 2'-phosphodiesterase (5'-nucleotidase family)
MRRAEAPLLLAESGDFLFKGKPRSQEEMAGARAKAEFILRSYLQMGYDAVLPGESDFAGGVSLLRDHEQKVIPFTCLNMVHARSGKPVFPPYRKISRGGTRFIVVGVIGQDLFPILTHLGGKEDLSLAKGGKKPLLIFGAHTRTPLLSPVSESGSLIFRPADRGTNLVEVLIEREGNPGTDGQIDYVDARMLDSYKKKWRVLADERSIKIN